MITFDIHDTFTQDGHITITFDGHAGTAPLGKDIVCAAASVISLESVTLADNLYKRGWLEDKPRSLVSIGHSVVSIRPRDEMYGICKRMIEVIEMGCVALCANDSKHCKMLHRIGNFEFPDEESFT